MVGWVRSPTAALWYSGLKNLALADWPLSGNHYDSFGSIAVGATLYWLVAPLDN